MKQKILTLTFMTFFLIERISSQTIQPTLFGQNVWWIDITNTTVSGTGGFSYDFDNRLSDIAASGVKYLRIGGISTNFLPLYNFDPTTFAIISAPRLTHLIDEIRNAEMKPIIEVGFNPLLNYYDGITCNAVSSLNNITQTNQAIIAGNLVDYFNNAITGIYKDDPIVDWVISNEPDLAKNCSPKRGLDLYAQTSAAAIASYVKEFATKMKDKDANITIMGPELASFGNDNGYNTGTGIYYNPSNKIMDDLVNNPANSSSIMGTIQSGNGTGKYYIDVLTFHYYPNISNRADVISKPSALQHGFRGDITDDLTNGNQWKGIIEMITDNSTNRALSGATAIGIACTEFNLENAETSFNESSPSGYSAMIMGVGNRSYLGGQWMTEILAEAMSNGLEFMDPWSVQEGNCTDGKGYISGCGSNNAKRPSYWHYKMVAENFAGNYLPNLYTTVYTNSTMYKAFAYKNTTSPNQIGVIVMNQDIQTSSPRGTDNETNTLQINFDGGTPSGADMLFEFAAANTAIGTSGVYNCTMTKETTMLLVFNISSGALVKKEVYSLGDALRAIDTGPEVWGTPSANTLTITDQDEFNGYYDAIYSDLLISPTSSGITESSGDSKVFRFTNTATVGGVNGDFTVPLGSEFTLLPVSSSCP